MIGYLFFPFALILCSSLGLFFSTSWAFAPFIWVLLIVPIIDFFLPSLNKEDENLNETTIHNLALIIILPGIILLIIFGLIKVADNNILYWEAAALGAAVGMSGGSIGITTAHELIHRSNKKMRAIGVMLLVLCMYGHFRIEHIYGHHKNFATKQDPATARKNENFYFYLIRCVIMSLISSWKIEKKILLNKNFSPYSIRNRIFHYFFMELLLLILCFSIAGLKGLIFILIHSVISIILLELVDYIQHYGLERKKKD